MPTKSNAFTLIELLIVVAIIAILAAIAVPNFLEAQTRAKVSRVKADMRTIATALESYAVDYNKYPLPDDIQGGWLNPGDARTFYETKISTRLTTPVAYVSIAFDDAFWNVVEPTETYRPYHYTDRIYAESDALESVLSAEFDAFYFSNFFSTNPAARWYLLSHGPDSDHDAGPSNGTAPGAPGHITGDGVTAYDPTNGTISNGDLTLWGPGIGFAGG